MGVVVGVGVCGFGVVVVVGVCGVVGVVVLGWVRVVGGGGGCFVVDGVGGRREVLACVSSRCPGLYARCSVVCPAGDGGCTPGDRRCARVSIGGVREWMGAVPELR